MKLRSRGLTRFLKMYVYAVLAWHGGHLTEETVVYFFTVWRHIHLTSILARIWVINVGRYQPACEFGRRWPPDVEHEAGELGLLESAVLQNAWLWLGRLTHGRCRLIGRVGLTK